ncbi:MAG: hypothetical protein LBI11_01295 [Streptococcaceae bacterium]|jgi:hypothetical protein|nr:hypothetical protein [Streptococcaceae bacterium]
MSDFSSEEMASVSESELDYKWAANSAADDAAELTEDAKPVSVSADKTAADMTSSVTASVSADKQPERASVLGILAIVFGGLGLLLFFAPFFGLLLAVVGLVLGSIGFIKNAHRKKVLSLTGFIISAVATLVTLLFTLFFVFAMASWGKSSTTSSWGTSSSSAYASSSDDSGLYSGELGDSSSSSSDSASDSTLTSAEALSQILQSARLQLPSMKAKYSDTYSNIEASSEGDNTLVFTYTYTNQVDAAAAKAKIDANEGLFQTSVVSDLTRMELKGVVNPQEKAVYKNADGTVITTLTAQ